MTPEKIADATPFSAQLFIVAGLFDSLLHSGGTEAGCSIWRGGRFAGWHFDDEVAESEALFKNRRNILSADGYFGYGSTTRRYLLPTLRSNSEQAGVEMPELVRQAIEEHGRGMAD